MTERGADFDAKREACDQAHGYLLWLCENPDKTVPVSEYNEMLGAAEVKMLEAHKAMMGAWG